MAGVKTTGMSAEQQGEFDKSWKLTPGQAYNGDDVQTFLQKLGGTRPFQGYGVKFGRTPDAATHMVTITILVLRPGARPS